MLYIFPAGTVAVAVRAYDRPYADPVAGTAGDEMVPDPERTATTDIVGWTWCTAADGREGWVPEAWLAERDGRLVLLRDFSAIELSVRPGDRVELILGESGFVYGRRATGEEGWVPDGAMALARPVGSRAATRP